MKKRTLILLIVNAALALLAGACLAVCLSLRGALESQKAAERWAGESEMGFAQLSCYMSGGDSLGLSGVYTFRQNLMNSLTEASVTAPENGSLFVDAWSAFGKQNVSGDHGSGEAAVVAVGGDWFFFHPLRLLSGSYIDEYDVMDDGVLLDRELAWRLFGGEDLAGLTVTVGGQPYRVSGVVDHETDFFSKKDRGEGGMTMYMPYSAYGTLTGDAPPAIDCYEAVLPQPVAGFAENVVETGFTLGGGELVNNTDRFRLGSIYRVIREFGTRSMHLNSVVYPEWENAARCLLDWCALFLALAIFFAVCPAVTAAVTLLVLLVRCKDFLVKKLPAAASAAVDRRRQKRWARRHPAP